MLQIIDDEIYLTRGDTAEISVTAKNSDGTDYTFLATDTVNFHCALKPGRTEVAISKVCAIDTVNNKAVLSLIPSDTEELEFKTYRYEFELVTESGAHYTFITDSPFTIGKEID